MKLPFKKAKPQQGGRQRPAVSDTPRQQVFSYYASQRQMQTRSSATPMRQREQEREGDKSFNWRWLPTIIAVVIIVFCLFVASTLSAKPKVHVRLAASGEQITLYRPAQAYRRIATEALGKSIFNKSKLTVQRDAIASTIRAQLPEVTSVKLATPLVSRDLVVSIETNEPGIIIRTASGTFVIDNTGTVITTLDRAPAVAGKDLPVVEDRADPQINLGKPLLAAQEVTFIRSLYKELIAQKLPSASFTLPNGIANELHVKFKDQAYFIKFAMNGDPRLQAGTYVAVKEKLSGQGTIAGEYIDVRVEGRAYYR